MLSTSSFGTWKVHIGERPYECRQCGKLFKYKSQSFGPAPEGAYGGEALRCGGCGKAYVTRSGLYQHRKVHTGELPTQCGLCGKTYTTRSYRKSATSASTRGAGP